MDLEKTNNQKFGLGDLNILLIDFNLICSINDTPFFEHTYELYMPNQKTYHIYDCATHNDLNNKLDALSPKDKTSEKNEESDKHKNKK